MKSKISFWLPFQSKRFFRLIAVCLLTLNFCSLILAAGDVQETDDAKRLVKQAEKLVRKGKLPEAEAILRRVVKQNPADSKTKLLLSYVLLKGQKIVEAYDISIAVAQAEPKNARAFALVGTILLGFGNFKDARVILLKAYQLDREEPLAWFSAGMLDFYENRISESVPKLSQAEYLDSRDADTVFSLAQVLARAEKYAEAGDAYERFLRISPITDSERRDRIKGLINFLRYLGGKQNLYDLDGDAMQTTVPIDLVNLRPIIEISIGNRREKFRFVLDTGSGMTVISDKMAAKLKMKPVARGGLARHRRRQQI